MFIEEYINNLKGNRNNSKISIALYDAKNDNYHFIYRINKLKDTCMMASTSIYPDVHFIELSLPFISQLNEYYGHCQIDEDNEFIGMNYEEIDKILKERYKKQM